MGKVALILTLVFTIIMATFTYHAYLQMQDAQKNVDIAKQELQTAQDEYSTAKSAFINEYEVPGNGGVVDSK